MDFGKLAEELTAYLAPALPYLQRAGEEVADEVGKKFAEGAWDRIKALWRKLEPRIAEREAAREATEDLAKQPGDARAKGAVELQLEKILTAEPSLAGEVAKLLEAAGPRTTWAYVMGDGAVAQGDGAVAAGKGGFAAGGSLIVGTPLPGTPRGSWDHD